MKGLAIYTTILLALVYLYIIASIIDGTGDTFENLFALALWFPPFIFTYKFLTKKK